MSIIQKPTIRQVAEACDVSAMTVSRVLNGKRERVSDETRERVLQAVRRLGYVPPSSAPAPSATRTALTLGIVTDTPAFSLMRGGLFYVKQVMDGVMERADELHHNLTLFARSLLKEDIHRSIRIYCDGRCDGLLVFSPFIGSPLLEALTERGVPFVTVGNLPPEPHISAIDIDNVGAAMQATEYLIAQGHRRIAYLNALDIITSSTLRAEGCQRALRAHHLPVSLEPVITDFSLAHRPTWRADLVWKEATRRLLSLPPAERPTAFLCFNDNVAECAIEEAREMGLRTPADVSVIGFDDLSSWNNPPLTTIRQPYQEIGARAVTMLLALINRTESGALRELLPTELIIRGSVRPPAPE